MRIGKVWLDVNLGYVVDLDNPAMVDHAKRAIVEDLQSLDREPDIAQLFKQRAVSRLTEFDIPGFLQEPVEWEDI